jgi:hypothetical protein
MISPASSALTCAWPDCTLKKACRVDWATVPRAASTSSRCSSSAMVSRMWFSVELPVYSGQFSCTPTLALRVLPGSVAELPAERFTPTVPTASTVGRLRRARTLGLELRHLQCDARLAHAR